MNETKKKYLAICLCLLIGALAMKSTDLQDALLGHTVMGGPMVALLVSMILCNVMPAMDTGFKAGTTFCSKKFLNWGIIISGGTLSFAAILGTGVKALPLLVINVLLSFAVALYVGKKLQVGRNTSVLVGGGTCICGGTAIATLSPIIKAKDAEIAFAMAAIFLVDTLAAFSFPYLAQLLGFTENQFAFLAGAAINDTFLVAGAQATFQAMIGNLDFNGALNVKLVRTTMLIFVAVAWSLILAKEEGNQQQNGKKDGIVTVIRKTFPMFILWFVFMAGLNTAGVFGPSVVSLMKIASKFLFAAALAGVGFKIKFKDVFSKGTKPILLGAVTWLAVTLVSLMFVIVFAGYIG